MLNQSLLLIDVADVCHAEASAVAAFVDSALYYITQHVLSSSSQIRWSLACCCSHDDLCLAPERLADVALAPAAVRWPRVQLHEDTLTRPCARPHDGRGHPCSLAGTRAALATWKYHVARAAQAVSGLDPVLHTRARQAAATAPNIAAYMDQTLAAAAAWGVAPGQPTPNLVVLASTTSHNLHSWAMHTQHLAAQLVEVHVRPPGIVPSSFPADLAQVLSRALRAWKRGKAHRAVALLPMQHIAPILPHTDVCEDALPALAWLAHAQLAAYIGESQVAVLPLHGSAYVSGVVPMHLIKHLSPAPVPPSSALSGAASPLHALLPCSAGCRLLAATQLVQRRASCSCGTDISDATAAVEAALAIALADERAVQHKDARALRAGLRMRLAEHISGLAHSARSHGLKLGALYGLYIPRCSWAVPAAEADERVPTAATLRAAALAGISSYALASKARTSTCAPVAVPARGSVSDARSVLSVQSKHVPTPSARAPSSSSRGSRLAAAAAIARSSKSADQAGSIAGSRTGTQASQLRSLHSGQSEQSADTGAAIWRAADTAVLPKQILDPAQASLQRGNGVAGSNVSAAPAWLVAAAAAVHSVHAAPGEPELVGSSVVQPAGPGGSQAAQHDLPFSPMGHVASPLHVASQAGSSSRSAPPHPLAWARVEHAAAGSWQTARQLLPAIASMAAPSTFVRSSELWRTAATAVSIMVATVCTAPRAAVVCDALRLWVPATRSTAPPASLALSAALLIASTACATAQDPCLALARAALAMMQAGELAQGVASPQQLAAEALSAQLTPSCSLCPPRRCHPLMLGHIVLPALVWVASLLPKPILRSAEPLLEQGGSRACWLPVPADCAVGNDLRAAWSAHCCMCASKPALAHSAAALVDEALQCVQASSAQLSALVSRAPTCALLPQHTLDTRVHCVQLVLSTAAASCVVAQPSVVVPGSLPAEPNCVQPDPRHARSLRGDAVAVERATVALARALQVRQPAGGHTGRAMAPQGLAAAAAVDMDRSVAVLHSSPVESLLAHAASADRGTEDAGLCQLAKLMQRALGTMQPNCALPWRSPEQTAQLALPACVLSMAAPVHAASSLAPVAALQSLELDTMMPPAAEHTVRMRMPWGDTLDHTVHVVQYAAHTWLPSPAQPAHLARAELRPAPRSAPPTMTGSGRKRAVPSALQRLKSSKRMRAATGQPGATAQLAPRPPALDSPVVSPAGIAHAGHSAAVSLDQLVHRGRSSPVLGAQARQRRRRSAPVAHRAAYSAKDAHALLRRASNSLAPGAAGHWQMSVQHAASKLQAVATSQAKPEQASRHRRPAKPGQPLAKAGRAQAHASLVPSTRDAVPATCTPPRVKGRGAPSTPDTLGRASVGIPASPGLYYTPQRAGVGAEAPGLVGRVYGETPDIRAMQSMAMLGTPGLMTPGTIKRSATRPIVSGRAEGTPLTGLPASSTLSARPPGTAAAASAAGSVARISRKLELALDPSSDEDAG